MEPAKTAVHRRILIAAFFLAAFIAIAADSFFAAYAVTTAPATATSTPASLQDQINTKQQQIQSLNQQIATYQAELQKVGADKRTLEQAIIALDLERSKMEAQVTTTKYQINITELQIQQLGGKIADAKQIIAADRAALAESLRHLQKADGRSFLTRIFSSNTITEAWGDINATFEAQTAVQNEIAKLTELQSNFADSQAASEQKQAMLASQQKVLATQQQSLAATVQSKTELLAQTDAKESSYQKLLAEAEAELQSFSAFAKNSGGSALTGSQTVCDSWGCYYNQRDDAWGDTPLNGTRYTLASDGCLVTVMAMIMTHYGYRDVTPATINADPSNFASYYPAYLLMTINVDGVSATRKAAALDKTLASGHPAVVGLRTHGGTHFIVIVSGKKGNYIMRDPYYADGNDADFSSRYSVRNIFSVARVVIK